MRSARDRRPPVSGLAALPHEQLLGGARGARASPGGVAHLVRHRRRGCTGRKNFKSVSTLLRPIQGGVDRVALGLLVRARGNVQAKGFSLVDATVHTPARPALASGEARSRRCPREVPRVRGVWHVLEDIEHARTIHAVQLQNGKLLLMAGSGNNRMEFEAGKFRSFIYDPSPTPGRNWKRPRTSSARGTCSSPNGNVLILGGTSAYPPPPKPGELPSTEYKGENGSWIFNIRTEKYEEVPWNKAEPHQPAEPGPLLNGAWYPSATELGNGDVISFGGLNERRRRRDGDQLLHRARTTTNPRATQPGHWVGFGRRNPADLSLVLGPVPVDDPDRRRAPVLRRQPRLRQRHRGIEQAPSGSSIYDFWCTPGKSPKKKNRNAARNEPARDRRRARDGRIPARAGHARPRLTSTSATSPPRCCCPRPGAEGDDHGRRQHLRSQHARHLTDADQPRRSRAPLGHRARPSARARRNRRDGVDGAGQDVRLGRRAARRDGARDGRLAVPAHRQRARGLDLQPDDELVHLRRRGPRRAQLPLRGAAAARRTRARARVQPG